MKKISYKEIKNKLSNQSIELKSNIDLSETFLGIKPISVANANELSFFSNKKYLSDLKNCRAKACIINEKNSKYLPKKCYSIIVNNPYLAFAHLSELFYDNKLISNGIISNAVNINSYSKIDENVQIDPYTQILNKTEIGKNTIIGSNSVIGTNVIIGKNCVIGNNVSISNSIIEDNSVIKPGVRIGSDGFGFEEKSKKKINHIGNVLIKKNTTIGSNTTIDRAVFESTIIGENSQIDNLVQIAHNVIIGDHAIIAAQVGIAGSTIIGNNVKIGGQAGISGHLLIGNNVTIAAKSGVTKNINNNKIVAGFPAKDINIWKREIVNRYKKI